MTRIFKNNGEKNGTRRERQKEQRRKMSQNDGPPFPFSFFLQPHEFMNGLVNLHLGSEERRMDEIYEKEGLNGNRDCVVLENVRMMKYPTPIS